MRRILTLLLTFVTCLMCFGQKTHYEVLYTFVFDQQKNDYVQQLDFATGSILRDGDKAIALNGKVYTVVEKDNETNTDVLKSLQYTVRDEHGHEYVMCFQTDEHFPEALKHHLIMFDTANPYVWTYYVTDGGKPAK